MANPLFEALNGNRMAGMLEQFQHSEKRWRAEIRMKRLTGCCSLAK